MKKFLFNNVSLNLVLGIIKYLGALLTNSVALFSDALYTLSCSLKNISINYAKKESKKTDNIYNVVIGAIGVLLGFIIILNIFTTNLVLPKFPVIIIAIGCYLITNVINALKYTTSFNENSNEIILLDRDYFSLLVIPFVVIVSYILTLFSKYLDILKYADVLAGSLIAVYLIIRSIRFIVINFKGEDTLNEKEIKDTLSKEKIIASTNKVVITKYGSSYKLTINISLKKEISMVDAYSSILEVANRLFKKFKNIEIISIYKSPIKEKKGALKNARNSGSRNSKKSTKKRDTKQKNKKR